MAGTRWLRRVAPMAVALLVLGTAGVARAGGASDQDKLQGDWLVASAQKGGEALPEEFLKLLKATFKGDKISLVIGAETKEGTVKLDATKKPATLDLTVEGKTALGIYQIVGKDELKVCFVEPGQARPTKFESPANSDTMLVVFKRAKAEKKKKAADPKSGAVLFLGDKQGKSDQEALQGTWKLVDGEKDGKKAPPQVLEKFKMSFAKDQITFHTVDKVGSFKIDPKAKPKTFDMTIDGKTGLGIYQIEGDTLKLCVREPGKDGRPPAFEAAAGSNTSLLILKRVTAGCDAEYSVLFTEAGDKKDNGDKKDKGDKALVQGDWKLVSGVKDGKEAPKEFVEQFKMNFTGDKIKLDFGLEIEGTFTLDPKTKPKSLTVTIMGKTAKGIYQLDKDALKICINDPDDNGALATEFKADEGSKRTLLVLKRAKPACQDEHPVLFVELGDKKKDAKDQQLLQGKWKIIEAEKEGEKAPQQFLDALTLEFKGDKLIMEFMGMSKEGPFKLGISGKLATIDLTIDGKAGQGIYHLDGDTLKLCMKEGTDDRPTEFKTTAGSKTIVMVLKRGKVEKKEKPPAKESGAVKFSAADFAACCADEALGDKKTEPKGKGNKELLQGSWKVLEAEQAGEKAPQKVIDALKVEFKGDILILEFMGKAKEGPFKLGSSGKFHTIDLTIDGKVAQGIYHLDGDALKLCLKEDGTGDRPTEFKTAAGIKEVLMVLKRAKAEKKEKPPAKESGAVKFSAADFAACCANEALGDKKTDKDGFQGSWKVIDAEKGGEKIPEEARDQIKIKFAGDKVQLDIMGGKQDGDFKLDPTKNPKTIDLTIDGKTALGIYQLDGDNLKVVMGDPGQARPKDFGGTGGTDNVLVVLKRAPTPKEEKKDGKQSSTPQKSQVNPGQPRQAEKQVNGDSGKPGPKTDKELLQGVWRPVGLEVIGKKQEVSELASMRLIFNGDKLTLVPGGSEDHELGTYKLDTTKTPRQLDLTLKGQTMLAIYRLEGDKLTICGSEPGRGPASRPTEFKTADSKVGMIYLERAKNERTDGFSANARVSLNNLKQIGLAMHNYHDANKKFPGAAIYSKDGKPLLSWRVAILPYVEQDQLYQQFKLDEPWDSEHNKKLIAQMPRLYNPSTGGARLTTTPYRVFTGPMTPFEGFKKDIRIQDFTDGTSNTILAVEAAEEVPWTKPEELPFDAKKPLPKLGGSPFHDRFHILMGDGSVRSVNVRFDATIFRAMITRNGGEPVNTDMLNLPPEKAEKGEKAKK